MAASTFLIFIRLPVSAGVSTFCGKSCHSMNPAYQSWRRSSHAKTACLSCHSDGSQINRFVKLVELSFKHIPKETRGEYRPIRVAAGRAAPDKACLGCHKPKDRSVSDIKIVTDHKKHKRLGLTCGNCHNRGPHMAAQRFAPIDKAENRRVYKNYLTMRAGCWRCHKTNGKFVAADGRTIRGPFKTRAVEASTKCGSCHAGYARANLKKNVEKIWLRHVEQPPWRQGTVHGQEARKVDFNPCKVCHNPATRCAVCHNGVKMPHDDNWLVARNHGAAAKATEGKACRICHGLKQVPGCSRNGHHHEEWVVAKKLDLEETPWKSGFSSHGPAARETNARPCRQCHNQATWCATQCHQGIPMPHGPEWRKVHFTAVGYIPGTGWAMKPTPCDMCHNSDGSNRRFCRRCHHKSLTFSNGSINLPTSIDPMLVGRQIYGLNDRLSTGIGPCAKCHAFQYCWRCHQDIAE